MFFLTKKWSKLQKSVFLCILCKNVKSCIFEKSIFWLFNIVDLLWDKNWKLSFLTFLMFLMFLQIFAHFLQNREKTQKTWFFEKSCFWGFKYWLGYGTIWKIVKTRFWHFFVFFSRNPDKDRLVVSFCHFWPFFGFWGLGRVEFWICNRADPWSVDHPRLTPEASFGFLDFWGFCAPERSVGVTKTA